jgi:uncharacterized membrane protein
MFPMWLYFAVAAAIAAIAFAIGQLFPGLGVMFVVLATTMWTAWSAYRQRKAASRSC